MSSPPSEQSHFPRSVVEAWHAAKPSERELQQSYSRFLRRRAPRRPALTFIRWLLAGALLGAGLAQAATSSPWRVWSATEVVRAAPSHGPLRAPARALSLAPQPSLPTLPEPEARLVSPTAAPPAPAKVVSSPPLAPAASAASFHIQEQWRMAAEGLRNGNALQAERALLDLEQTARGGEREAAQLARAQLLSRSGRSGEARGLARALEESASSVVVRDKARELRESLSKNSEDDRSRRSGAVINQP